MMKHACITILTIHDKHPVHTIVDLYKLLSIRRGNLLNDAHAYEAILKGFFEVL